MRLAAVGQSRPRRTYFIPGSLSPRICPPRPPTRRAGRAGLKAKGAAPSVNCGHGVKHICFASAFDGEFRGQSVLTRSATQPRPPPPPGGRCDHCVVTWKGLRTGELPAVSVIQGACGCEGWREVEGNKFFWNGRAGQFCSFGIILKVLCLSCSLFYLLDFSGTALHGQLLKKEK